MARKKIMTFQNGYTVVSVYERGVGKYFAKITLNNSFTIYANVIIVEDENGKRAFLSYPSFKTDDGKYIRQVICVNDGLNESINEEISAYILS